MKKRTLLRILVAYLLFLVLGFIAISTFTSKYNERYMIRQEASALRRESTSLASDYARGYDTSEETLKSLHQQWAYVSSYIDADIYLVDINGRILVNSLSYSSPDATETIENFNILSFGTGTYSIGDFYQRYDEHVLSVYTTITANYKAKSYVVICKPISRISDMQYDQLNVYYLTLVILFLLSLLPLCIYLLTIYRPIRTILKAAATYAGGDFSKVIELKRSDELGFLSDTMNYMAQELDSLEEDQRKFISNISHDFRSPLTSIKGYAEAIADGTIPQEMQSKYLGIIVFETERLEKLTQSLLELNKYGAKGTFLDLTEFDINQLIKRTVLSFEGRCKDKMMTVNLLLTGESMFVKADSSKIDQVLHNLIDNAIKFSHNNSEIKIETTVRSEKLFISVKDSGIGIPKDSQKKIWERFYKTDLSRGKDKKGTGLGLSIVKEIIHAHHENINVISTEGVGTEFIFSLPLAKSQTTETSILDF